MRFTRNKCVSTPVDATLGLFRTPFSMGTYGVSTVVGLMFLLLYGLTDILCFVDSIPLLCAAAVTIVVICCYLLMLCCHDVGFVTVEMAMMGSLSSRLMAN